MSGTQVKTVVARPDTEGGCGDGGECWWGRKCGPLLGHGSFGTAYKILRQTKKVGNTYTILQESNQPEILTTTTPDAFLTDKIRQNCVFAAAVKVGEISDSELKILESCQKDAYKMNILYILHMCVLT